MNLTLNPQPDQTILGTAALIRSRALSCLELLEKSLAILDAQEPSIRAFVLVDRENALRQARACDEALVVGNDPGPLLGIPIGVKDIIDVAGLPTAGGLPAPLSPPTLALHDAPLVSRLRAAGAVILGKTVTTPGAWIDPPPTRNPWNTNHTPGGSSSGSAAAVASGSILAALGSQTGGSVSRPAAFCGLPSLKPTYGALPSQGFLPLAPTLDHPGFFARTAHDLLLLWTALAVDHPLNPTNLEATDSPPTLARLRGPFDKRPAPSMHHALEQALQIIAEAGSIIFDASWPPQLQTVWQHHRALMAAEAAQVHRHRLQLTPTSYPPHLMALITEGRNLSPNDLALSYRFLRQSRDRAEFDLFPPQADALVCAAALGPAPDLSTTGDPFLNSPWSFLGLPCLTLPIGLDDQGLPLALQLIGRPHKEAPLLRTAIWCEPAMKTTL